MINALKKRPDPKLEKKLSNKYGQFEDLLALLRKESLSLKVVDAVNVEVNRLNKIQVSEKLFSKQLSISMSHILKLIEKEHKLVTKGHYRNTWLALGMAVFGIPIGLAFGLTTGNMGFLAIGLPIGMGIGIAIGIAKDNKAFEIGKQLDIEIKY